MNQITVIVREVGKTHQCVFDGNGNHQRGDLAMCAKAIRAITTAHSTLPAPTQATASPPPAGAPTGRSPRLSEAEPVAEWTGYTSDGTPDPIDDVDTAGGWTDEQLDELIGN